MNEQPTLVYLYGFSTSLESKLNTIKLIIENQLKRNSQITFIFIQDGVIGTSLQNKISRSMKKLLDLPITFFSMVPDLKARGLDASNLQNKIKGIEYEDLVDILVTNSKIISWM
ncbi:MAG: sulfurtransferase complex subunit TusB [Candidatus Hermodarchaeota archaeon]